MDEYPCHAKQWPIPQSDILCIGSHINTTIYWNSRWQNLQLSPTAKSITIYFLRQYSNSVRRKNVIMYKTSLNACCVGVKNLFSFLVAWSNMKIAISGGLYHNNNQAKILIGWSVVIDRPSAFIPNTSSHPQLSLPSRLPSPHLLIHISHFTLTGSQQFRLCAPFFLVRFLRRLVTRRSRGTGIAWAPRCRIQRTDSRLTGRDRL